MSVFDDLKKVHPLLLKKWNRAFSVFFDINRNKTLEWDDFENLVTIVKENRGEDSDEYKMAQSVMKKIWNALLSEADVNKDETVTTEEWDLMWYNHTKHGKNSVAWQQMYLDYMFRLLDATGDLIIDLSEYIDVMRLYGINRKEAEESFDKFARNAEGQNLFAIDYETYCRLWKEYFESTDPDAPGNFLFGDIEA